MKEFIISDVRTETAVLVGLITPEQNERKVKEYLDELAFLADTAGVEAVKRFTQKLDAPNSVTFVGSGKLQEIKDFYVQGWNLVRDEYLKIKNRNTIADKHSFVLYLEAINNVYNQMRQDPDYS